MFKPVEEQLKAIKRAAVEIISEEELLKKLRHSYDNKRQLIVKAGFDPTSSDLHLGHTVLLEKLRAFQDLGHKAVFLIGDYTAMIGDPSGQSQARKMLSASEVEGNLKTYLKQARKILKTDRAVFEIKRNSAWLSSKRKGNMHIDLDGFMALASRCTISRLIERDDFSKRLKENKPVSLLETFYPLMQAYDSVVLKADIELGGIDQKFNLLMARDLQRDFGQEPQALILMPLLPGLDGTQKMSKSFGNYVGIDEPPKEIFGKLMSVSDALMMSYYELLTDEDLSFVKQMHPREAKERLAFMVVGKYHSKKEAERSRDEFKRVFSNKELPDNIPEYRISGQENIVKVMTDSGMAGSGNEARRLIAQGAVSLDGGKIVDDKFSVARPGILKAGSRRFLKIAIQS